MEYSICRHFPIDPNLGSSSNKVAPKEETKQYEEAKQYEETKKYESGDVESSTSFLSWFRINAL